MNADLKSWNLKGNSNLELLSGLSSLLVDGSRKDIQFSSKRLLYCWDNSFAIMFLRAALSLSCCCKFDDKFEYCTSAPVSGRFSAPCSRFRLSFLQNGRYQVNEENMIDRFVWFDYIDVAYISELLMLLPLVLAACAEQVELTGAAVGSVMVLMFPESRFCRE